MAPKILHKNKIGKYFNYPSTKVLTRKRYGIMMHVLVTNLLTAPCEWARWWL